jgi:predicted O-linked N-acetylglucosamine transferase (SPINDLY family)
MNSPHVPALAAPSPDDSSKLDATCANAMQLQLGGRLDLAEQLYQAVLQASPQHAPANYCLGMLRVQLRRPEEGLPYLKAALQTQLDIPDYWLGYLEALRLVGRTEAARNILILGRRHGLAGSAVDEFERRLQAQSAGTVETANAPTTATTTAPNTAPAPAATQPLKLSKATRKTRRNRDREIRRHEAELLALVGQQKNADALALARCMSERFPECGLGWKILGALMPRDEVADEAIAVMRTAVRLLPRDAEAHVNLGISLARAKRPQEGEGYLRRAIELDPGLAAAHFRLAVAYELQGRYAEAEASLRRGRELGKSAMSVARDDELSYSHLLFFMAHNPAIGAEELFAEHRRFGEHFESRLRPAWPQHANNRDPERCLEVGLVSGDFYNHSVPKFLEPILRHLAGRPGMRLHAYYNGSREDETTRRLQAHCGRWNRVGELTDSQLADRVMVDGIDVLIDLSGHTGFNRLPLFARKPAPVQVSWLGYPGTTGLQAMDYYLADEHWLPPGRFDHLFTEKLAYLPDRWAFELHPNIPPIGPLPALKAGHLTFGSFHRLGKITPAAIHLWSQLLLAQPRARLLLVGIPLDGEQAPLLRDFAAQGIDLARLTLHDRTSMDGYLALHNQVDIALDTQPYGGATTTMHSLSMGVPTLTIAGATSMSRACAGILSHVGLQAFAANDTADFVNKAHYWSNNLPVLAKLRADLRSRHNQSPGGQPPLIAAHLEAALRHMWRRWCENLPAESFATGPGMAKTLPPSSPAT